MSTSRPIVFFGTEEFSLSALSGLLEAGYTIAAVITKPDAPRGRGHKLTPPTVKIFAESRGIAVLQPATLHDIEPYVALLDRPVGVLSSFGKIVPQRIINLFTPGIINIHPSLLPLYRGPSPIESAILRGDDKTGVSLMQLAAKMDAGPIYTQVEIQLNGAETKPELYAQLASLGSQLLIEHLPDIIADKLLPEPQNQAAASYCPLLSKTDSLLDPSAMTARDAERKVRAYLGFPKTRLRLDDHDVIITRSHVADQPKTPLDYKYRDGAYLVIDELVAPSGRTMSASAYLNGQRA